MDKVIVFILILLVLILFFTGYEILMRMGLNLWGYTITLMIGIIITKQVDILFGLNK